jgi:ATP-binding cassette subfamily B protein
MNYNLAKPGEKKLKTSTWSALNSLLKLISNERKNLLFALLAIFTNATINLSGPFLIGYTIDHYIQTKQYNGVLLFAGVLLCMYLVGLVASYLQTKLMGSVGQRTLYNLRNAIFNKLQHLPVAFFNQNKAGDLISRINSDTDKLNQFFSQSLLQFVSSIVTMTGAGIFLLLINVRLGLAALIPAVLILIFTRVLSPWVKRTNAVKLKTVGSMSAEIQDSVGNFKAIIAFNRRDYFRKRLEESNQQNYKASLISGLANTIFPPVYELLSSTAQLIVLTYGVYLIADGQFSIGLLVSYLAYATYFYNPLRQLAVLWVNFQLAMAGWDRIAEILSLDSDLVTAPVDNAIIKPSHSFVEFSNVHFKYPDSNEILHNINFKLERGKTYAFVGPTGGGKTTTASLIARLYDPTKGNIIFEGKDLRSYSSSERAEKIGFILQEPFLFTGTVRENILYGNSYYSSYSNKELQQVIKEANLESLLAIFDKGLETPVLPGGDSISLGQKQLIAFMRAVLRKPALLILDEATANIDTITEKLLSKILDELPKETTRVIIAHRLNTIENADEIFFVNSGEVTPAGSFSNALDKLLNGVRVS